MPKPTKVTYPQEYRLNSPEYAALLNTKHYDELKNLRVVDGKIEFFTGAFWQPIDERIRMFEQDFEGNEAAQAALDRIEDQKQRQREYLRSL